MIDFRVRLRTPESLKAWVPWERKLGFTQVSGSMVELDLDVGDVLVSFPVLKALRETFPDSNMSILIGSWSIELLRLNKNINKTIVFDLPS